MTATPPVDKPTGRPLRYGWTTGACAAAAARGACEALLTGRFPAEVTITLPKGQTPSFPLVETRLGEGWAEAGVVKDAGDDPDVTHGALVRARVERGPAGAGVLYRAGEGVGTVTRAGLPIPPGEPAINPGPRAMIAAAITDAAQRFAGDHDVVVTVSIPGGEALARKTLNGRLGIVGGLSVLGTTGIVVPFSCAAWIHSIHRGIDVARAAGLTHIAAATGSTSEAAVQRLHGLPEMALIDMGDFVGGTLKYLRNHPVPRVTLAGGFAKIVKLAQGQLDLHSNASRVDLAALAAMARDAGADASLVAAIAAAAGAGEALALADSAGIALARLAAARARATALAVLAGDVALEVAVFDRAGMLIGRAGAE
ncbi:MAG: cobalt-precorrin-5B (C(1))-methyltransferase [Alphaproteobacteria bacterium]|nr:cobalt-precorrin-5B (C(1))-methyltransferase [Alphaproteobacteria bacterium]